MSSFEVKIYKINVLPHPNADALELAQVGDYLSAIPKGVYKTGDLVAYIPEQAILPENIINELGLGGKLAGSKKNRVKAISLRNIVSQGLIYPNNGNWSEGEVITELLDIKKHVQIIPQNLDGEVIETANYLTLKYDIENFKKFPDVIVEGEEVQITEKLHGTFSSFAAIPTSEVGKDKELSETLIEGQFALASKGLGSKNLVFIDSPKNIGNAYLMAARKLDLFNLSKKLADKYNEVVIIAGEIFGSGIQDLTYGEEKIQFRLFDIAVGKDKKRFLNDAELNDVCAQFNIERVPVLYRGKFSRDVLNEHTNGLETISGKSSHIREGVVVKPLVERYDLLLRRVVLKSISDDYLLRKNGTEYN